MALSVPSSEQKLFQEAKEMVGLLEKRYPTDPNKVRAELNRAVERIPAQNPTVDGVHKMRVLELARAYAPVSDGVGGLSPEAHKTSLNALQNVINGKAPFGGGYTQSVRMAQEAGLIESPKARSPFSVKGVAGGLVATFAAGASAAAESGATVESVGNAALNSAIPGAAEARQNNLCGAFGQIAGASAGGAAMAATAVPAAAAATAITAASGPAAPIVLPLAATAATVGVGTVGMATEAAVTPAAEAACKAVSKALGLNL